MTRYPRLLTWLATAPLLAAVGTAQAQKVYRCGAEGRVVYQQSPCNEGKAIDASDTRSAEQRKAAQDVARDEAKAAAKFDRDSQPASAPKGSKPQSAAPAASSAKAAPAGKKASEAEKPLVFLVPPPKPKAAPSTSP
jgi:hypothetical protein